jgi:hypothetical protein
VTSVTAIHAKTSGSGKKCPESGTNIYPDLLNTARSPIPQGIVIGFADTQYEHPLYFMVSLEFDFTTRQWCTAPLSVEL